MPARTPLRPEGARDREAGFTLIELIIVVLIIGMLASIAIPVFLSVQTRAKDVVLQTDLAAAKAATVAWTTSNSTGMPAIGTDLASFGYTASRYTGVGVPPNYQSGSTATLFCIVGTSNSGQQYSVTANGAVRKGFCPFSTSEW